MKSLQKGRTIFAATLLSSVAIGPFLLAPPAAADDRDEFEHAKSKPMHCADLATFVTDEAGQRLNKNPVSPSSAITISSATPVTAAIVPAAQGTLTYCQVVFQLNPAITIQVGLPLNEFDGGQGGLAGGCGDTSVANNSCVRGNWNGKVEAIGNGGFSGRVPGVTSATNVGFVGSSTDNGHSVNWCNAINPQTGKPNAQPNCGLAGAGFVLDTDNNLNKEIITDFIDTSIVDQTKWAKKITEAYYQKEPKRIYWNGCSTGGRQGFQMAQFHPDLFDGILAGAPAFNWQRLVAATDWIPIVLADVDPGDCPGGNSAGCNTAGGVPSAAFTNAYTAANQAAVAACDANDGVVDGVINEPRRCTFDAKTLVGKTVPPMTTPMTVAQAQAINMMWDGPRNQREQRLWGGLARGTSFGPMIGYTGGNNSGYAADWVYQNPNFNMVSNINTQNFSTFFELSDRKFADTEPPPPGFAVAAATDSIDLDQLIDRGVKLIHYRGSTDPLIMPFNSWTYDTRLFEKYGVRKTEKFYRSFYYPGNGHCSGNTGFPNAGLINTKDLLNSLINWVENDDAPNSIVAYTQANDAGNTTLICSNPQQTVYKGGPKTSASSYACTNVNQEPDDLAAYDQTAKQYHEVP
jgi:feruloyl esterase